MAEYSRFFPSIASDRLYTASQVDEYLYETLEEENGVLHLPTGSAYDGMLAVTNAGTLSVDIDTGCAVKSGVLYLNSASLNKALSSVTSGSLRIDRIVIRTSVANRNMVATIITGTETTGTPAAPAIVDATDVLLAKILIDRSTGTYVYTVTDERVYRPYVFVSDAALAAAVHAASAKTALVDADELPLADSGDSFNLKHITWAYFKTAIVTAWGALINVLTGKTTPADNDAIALMDSADTNATKKLTIANWAANIWTRLGGLIAGGTNKATIVDADKTSLSDSAATNATKYATAANWFTYISGKIGAWLAGLTDKTTPIDADNLLISDSAASNASKKLTFANLWAWVVAKIEAGTATATPADTDILPSVSAAHAAQKSTWAQIKAAIATYLDRASTAVKGIVLLGASGGATKLTDMPDGVASWSNNLWTTGFSLSGCTSSVTDGVITVTPLSAAGFLYQQILGMAGGQKLWIKAKRATESAHNIKIMTSGGLAITQTEAPLVGTDFMILRFVLPSATEDTVIRVYPDTTDGTVPLAIDWVWVGVNPFLSGTGAIDALDLLNDVYRTDGSGNAAVGGIIATGIPAANSYDTIAGKKYKFVAALTASPGIEGEVLIGATKEDCLENENLAISETARTNNGVKYWAAAINPSLSSVRVGASLNFTARSVGVWGDQLTIVCGSGTNHTAMGGTLRGGYSASAQKIKSTIDKIATVNNLVLRLPPTIYAVVGRECNIYFANLLNRPLTGLIIDVVCVRGKQQAERWTYIPVDDTDYALSIFVYDEVTGSLLASASSTLVVVAAAAGSGAPKLLMIGDSTTSGAETLTEIETLMAADTAMDVEFVGTQGTAPRLHEGHAGWTVAQFCITGSPLVKAGVIDFPAYIADNSLSGCDIAIIHLGINDIFASTTDATADTIAAAAKVSLDALIASMKAYNSSIKIGLALTIPPSASQDAFGTSYDSGQNRYRYRRNLDRWHKMLLESYGYRTAENIYLVPYNTCLDTEHCMSFATAAAWNSRAALTTSRQNNGVHPDTPGYYQIADALYAWIKAIS